MLQTDENGQNNKEESVAISHSRKYWTHLSVPKKDNYLKHMSKKTSLNKNLVELYQW